MEPQLNGTKLKLGSMEPVTEMKLLFLQNLSKTEAWA